MTAVLMLYLSYLLLIITAYDFISSKGRSEHDENVYLGQCKIVCVCLVFVFYHDSVFNTSSICPNHMCISSGNIRVIPDVD